MSPKEGFQDLWQGLWVTFALFDENWRGELLGLSPLNGDLFGSKTLTVLNECALDNYDLMVAIRNLSLYRPTDKAQLRRVNYAALDVEELGSVYESLLDFHPQVIHSPSPPTPVPRGEERNWEFLLVAGSDRKTTGAYYTPSELVAQLVKSALEPVIAERLKGSNDPQKALLSIKVCDPACGSGHFLLAAARRIGKELARVRTGEPAPSPEPLRLAIRDVVQHCIYGVDVNPLAVDLCKVALWIEGFAKGMPLNFLDHRIKCGNSLVGVLDLDVLQEGIPDEAFKAVTGDRKELATTLKKQNKSERSGQGSIFDSQDLESDRLAFAAAWQQLDTIPDTSPQSVRQKAELYTANRKDSNWWKDHTACNLWTAAFFMPLTEQNLQLMPTTALLKRWLSGDASVEKVITAANQLAEEKRFFHWALEFPDVFDHDGFDCILGNPPWERIKLQEKEFFASRDVEIAKAANKAEREKLIKTLSTRKPELAREFEDAKHDAEAQSKFIRESNRFPLTAVGDVNTYAVFSETARNIISPNGRAGIIVPTGIATDDTCKSFFADLIQSKSLANLYDFENREIFSSVHRSYKFSLIGISGKPINQANFAFFATQVNHLSNPNRVFQLAPADIALMNPNTLTCPVFRTREDAELTKKIYQRLPVLENEKTGMNPWGISFMTMFHMSNDSGLFAFTPQPPLPRGEEEPDSTQNPYCLGSGLSSLPLYEAKMFHQFNHRWATYHYSHLPQTEEQGLRETRDVTLEEINDPSFTVTPRYWVDRHEVENRLAGKWNKNWLIGFRDITNSTNERTAIFSLLPRVAFGNTSPICFTAERQLSKVPCLIANFSSLVFDFVTRQKVGGTHLTYFYLKQLPVIPPDRYTETDINYITPRVLELTYTAWDIKPFADDIWNPTPTPLATGENPQANEGVSILTQAIAKQQLGLDLELDLTGKKQLELTTPSTQDPTQLRQLILQQWQANRTAIEPDPHPPTPQESENLGIPLPPFIWHETRRAQIRAELDAYYAKLYGLTRDELRYILDPADVYGADFPSETFRVLKTNEIKKYGEYRTQRLVLEAWDKLGY